MNTSHTQDSPIRTGLTDVYCELCLYEEDGKYYWFLDGYSGETQEITLDVYRAAANMIQLNLNKDT